MTLDGSDLIRHARERIAGYKVPKTVEVVPELPRNASGKVLRRELREKYWAGRDRRVN
jgi:acyl-CoA synthetase (AMP-forming)/AMP-acid ligase II